MASPDHSEYSPALSPDGRWMACVSNRSGRDPFFITEGHLVSSAVAASPAFEASPPRRLFAIAPYAEYGVFNRNYE